MNNNIAHIWWSSRCIVGQHHRIVALIVCRFLLHAKLTVARNRPSYIETMRWLRLHSLLRVFVAFRLYLTLHLLTSIVALIIKEHSECPWNCIASLCCYRVVALIISWHVQCCYFFLLLHWYSALQCVSGVVVLDLTRLCCNVHLDGCIIYVSCIVLYARLSPIQVAFWKILCCIALVVACRRPGCTIHPWSLHCSFCPACCIVLYASDGPSLLDWSIAVACSPWSNVA